MSWQQTTAYKQKAIAPAIIERDSRAANASPSLTTASPSVASATDGAAEKSPAKLFGFKTSPSTANSDTIVPPIANRKISSAMGEYSSQSTCDCILAPEGARDNGAATGTIPGVIPERCGDPR